MPANNNLFQRNANISMIAQLIWKQNGISRVDISRQLKLNKSTVSNIISTLLSHGLVNEGEHKDSCALGGRKPIELTINRSFGCVFGFDLQPSHYRTVILSVDGSMLWEKRGEKKQLSFESFVTSVIDEAFEEHKRFQIPLLALSFSLPGQIDSERGIIDYSYPFRLSNYNFKSFIKRKYDYPVFVDNDANCAAYLDLHSTLGHDFTSDCLSIVADFHEEARKNDYVAGIGTGMGIIIDGKIYKGAHNSAGEFCSISWKSGDRNQSGLSLEILQSTIDNKKDLAIWVRDTFLSLVPLCSVMDFSKVILHGNPFQDEMWVRDVLESDVPYFIGVLKKNNGDLLLNSTDEMVSAKGAALMYLHDLYSIPELEKDDREKLSWDEVMEFSQKEREKGGYR